jgi:hypothetical protein
VLTQTMATHGENPVIRLLALPPARCLSEPHSPRLKIGRPDVLLRTARMLEEPGIVPDCSLTLDDLFPDLIRVQGPLR